jgi:cytidine deaminase
MRQLSQSLQWQEFDELAQLSEEDRQLLALAKDSLKNAHAPYSNFRVGAAALLENGVMLGGSNQENAAYPMCLCAERVALSTVASQQPNVLIKSMAITVKAANQLVTKPAMPCGSCRQALCEAENKQGQAIRIIVRGEIGMIRIFNSAKDILPFSFDASYL